MTEPVYRTAPALEGLDGITHGFFTRAGGVSSGIYDGLNVGTGSGDVPGAVTENRARVARALGADDMVSVYQVHGCNVVAASAPWEARPEGDAMVSATPGLALCIVTADCVPVLFADPEAGLVGAAHAGWKGALAGVCEATLDAMEGLGAARGRIRAAIGPSIQQASYEVGPDLRDVFMADDRANARWFHPGKGDRFQFDLTGHVEARLGAAGLSHVARLPDDTCADPAYFSNRRRTHAGEPDYGRNASVIMLRRQGGQNRR